MNYSDYSLKKFIPAFLIIFSAFIYVYVFCQGIVPRAIDAGLVLSGVVTYTEHTAMQSFILKSPAIFYDLSGWLIALGLSVKAVGLLLQTIPVVFNIFGAYLIINTLSKNKFISLSSAILCVISQIFFIWVDYPIMFFSEHSGGIYSFSIITLTFGLLVSKNYRILGFLLVFNFAIHAVVAGLLLTFTATWIFIEKNFNKNLTNYINLLLNGALVGLIVAGLYFLYKYIVGNINYMPLSSPQDYLDWIRYWDTHRSIEYGSKGIFYILNQALLVLLLFCILRRYPDISWSTIFFIYLLLICLFIYLLKPLYPDFARRFMVNRVAIFPQFVVMVYFISVYLKSGRYLFYRFFLLFVAFSIFLISGFIYSNHILELPDAKSSPLSFRGFLLRAYVTSQPYIGGFERMRLFRSDKNAEIEKTSLPDLKSTFGNGLMVTTPSISREVLIEHQFPIILDPGGYDFVSYYPKYATEVKTILTLIYGVEFSGKSATGNLIESDIKLNFEKKSHSEWLTLSEQLGVRYVSVPAGWYISLKPIFSSKKLQIYIIE